MIETKLGTKDHEVDLTSSKIQNANLSRADLTYSNGLMEKDLRGCNLSGTRLPFKCEFAILSTVEELSKNARTIFFLLFGSCIFCFAVNMSLSDAELFIPESKTQLPLIGTQVTVDAYFLIAPIVLTFLFYLSHIYLQNLWRSLSALPSYFHDGIPLSERAYPFLLSSIALKYSPLLGRENNHLSKLSFLVIHFIVWGIVPTTLVSIWLRYLIAQDTWLSFFHIFLISLSIIFSSAFFKKMIREFMAKEELKARERKQAHKLIFWLMPFLLLALMLTIILSPWLSMSKVDITKFGIFHADLSNKELSIKPKDWAKNIDEKNDWIFSDVKPFIGQKVRLAHANLNETFLVRADLSGAILTGADLTGADLRRATLIGTILTDTKMNEANLAESSIVTKFCNGLTLHSSDLTGSTLRGDFRKAIFTEADLSQVTGENSNFSGAEMMRVTIVDSDFSEPTTSLIKANMRDSTISGTDFSGALMTEADLSRSKVSGTQFDGTDLTNSFMRGVELSNLTLRFTNLENANLRSATFDNVTFVKVNLKGADLLFCKGLTKAMLDQAITDSSTKLPANLR
jgi:uncharacterized protein YjbI with pentapeptide repeats